MTLAELNALPEDAATAELLRCCGSTRWATRMAQARPFTSVDAVLEAADRHWAQTGPDDWREAMTHHPRIGESALRAKFASTAQWSRGEQQGVQGASAEVIDALARGNSEYEARFGFIFLICATGKTAAQMLDALGSRLKNGPDEELRVAASEQQKITRIRLEKLLT